MCDKCKWGYDDCKYEGERCYMCFTEGQKYTSNQKNKPKKSKVTKRKGAKFEAVRNDHNNKVYGSSNNAVSKLTANSGATPWQKGDIHINCNVNIMEELKEQNCVTSKGEKYFTVHEKWLSKLKKEAIEAGKDFWYLVFCFSEADAEKTDSHYVIIESEVIENMVKTMDSDRELAKICNSLIDIKEKELQSLKVNQKLNDSQLEIEKNKLELKDKEIQKLSLELEKVNAELELLKSKTDLIKLEKKINNIFKKRKEN